MTPTARWGPPIAALAVAVVVSLTAGLLVVAFDGGGGDRGARPGADDPASAGELDAAVATISAFVEANRALEFRQPVSATLLADDEFEQRVREDALDDLEQVRDTEDVLIALGQLPDGADLAAELTAYLSGAVVGFYDPETNELVVRGGAITPYVRATLAHELAHALDDQHFELDRESLEEDDEAATSFASLVEGVALSVQEGYEETFDAAEIERMRDEQLWLAAGFDDASFPPVIAELIGFPYAGGPVLVEALMSNGGPRRIDAAFADPPVTTEQVLDPHAWLGGDAEPVDVPAPPADGEVFDEGVFGQWWLTILLEEELDRDAFDAADGWGGDWYVAWRDGEDTCVRTTVVMDTPADLRELTSALEVWSAGQDDATVAGAEDHVTFTACG